jgi:hypothetical protein
VITAETIVWLEFLMGEFWKAERKKDREMYERIGYVTTAMAGRMALTMIKSETGFDFVARAIESRKLYIQSVKDGTLSEAFASVVLRSVGCKSLADPVAPVRPPHRTPPEWTPISLLVGIFFSTIPSGYYDTFKSILREHSELFPHDEDILSDDEDDALE